MLQLERPASRLRPIFSIQQLWWLFLVCCIFTAASIPAAAQQRIHVVRMGGGFKRASNSCSFAPQVFYNGGPVLSNVKVYAVFWGPNVDSQTTGNIGNFFTAVTSSPLLDLLSEYNTVGVTPTPPAPSVTTNQVIGRGSFSGSKMITPSVCNTTSACTVDDTQIQAELIKQITAGQLPDTSVDGGGNVNTLYMFYFPANITITQGGSQSCSGRGAFCAYHGTTASQLNSHNLVYGVNPDIGPTSACYLSCGSAANWYDELTGVSSHEMGESVTDAGVGNATTNAPPLAWYDNNCGEIGDMCNGQQVPLTIAGTTYTVQQLWSNRQDDCVSSGPALVPKFHVVAPSNATPGVQFNVTVTAQDNNGATLTNYTGTVHFTSSDSLATLPSNYTFTSSNAGTHGFVATLRKSGPQTITVNGTTATVMKGTANVAVAGATSSTSLVSSANPVSFGQSVTFTAKVTSTTAGTPTGTVTFKDGTSNLGTGVLSSATATLATSALAVGTHTITAVYGGDITFSESTSSTLSQTVSKASTSTTLSSSGNPGATGHTVTFTAKVRTAGVGVPTGSVTFKNGTTSLGTVALNTSAIAALSTSFSTLGSYSITAAYGGDVHYTGSTSAILIEVIKNATTTSVVSSVNPSTVGHPVTFTATVKSTVAGTLTGAVTFMNGTTVLGSPTINTTGVAALSTSALVAGSHSITALYSGNPTFASSTSTVLTQRVVGTKTSTTALVSNLNPSIYGHAVTFTATVSSASAPTPTGTVTFMNGTATLGTVALTSGVAKFTTSATTLSGGSHTIKATYNGDATYNVSSKSITQTVNKAATSTKLTSSANPATLGTAVTFTATVTSSGAGTFTGTVTFKDGTTATVLASPTISSSGVATFTTKTLAHGTHSITSQFNGNTNFATSTSAVLMQTVN